MTAGAPCPHCNRDSLSADLFCSRCGGALQEESPGQRGKEG